MKDNNNNGRSNFVFALGFIVILLVSGTVIGPYVAEALVCANDTVFVFLVSAFINVLAADFVHKRGVDKCH